MSAPPPGRAYIVAHWKNGDSQPIAVQYNPGELTFEKKLVFAEVAIPGLTAPLQQFVRGDAETLSIELFYDTSDKGMGIDATSVATLTDQIYSLARIEPDGHAPPPLTFYWGQGFPGSQTSKDIAQKRDSFTGVITSIRQHFTLFSAGGVPLRAKLTLSVREFKKLDEQLAELNLSSPDRTHAHVLASGEQLWTIAGSFYSQPAEWRRIADANAVADPRRITPGTRLSVPSIERGRAAR